MDSRPSIGQFMHIMGQRQGRHGPWTLDGQQEGIDGPLSLKVALRRLASWCRRFGHLLGQIVNWLGWLLFILRFHWWLWIWLLWNGRRFRILEILEAHNIHIVFGLLVLLFVLEWRLVVPRVLVV